MDSHALNFYAPVLNYLSAKNIDIVFENKLYEGDGFVKVTEKHKIIIPSNSQDSFFTDIKNNFYCIIYSTQAQAEAFGLRNSENIISLPNIRCQKKCEFTYTGPYHMDDFWDCKKEILRKKLKINIIF